MTMQMNGQMNGQTNGGDRPITVNAASMGTPGVLEQMGDARATCRELLHLLAAENQGLAQKRVDEIEVRLQQKRRLTLRLEVILKDIKQRKQEWVTQPAVQDTALRLAEEIGVFQDLAAKNLELLKAAHQLRADMVAVIRDTIEAQSPRVQTYGRSGYMAAGVSGRQVLARDV